MTAQFAISIPIGAWHPLLGECLKSLNAQGDRVEIAALDASGDPRVAALLDRYDSRLAYRRNGPDKGQSDAIIEGWRATGAPVLGWLNADDALYPGALAAAAAMFDSDPTLDLVYGDSTIIDDDNVCRGFHWAVRPPGEDILTGCTISQPSCFFRRAVIDGIGGLDVDLHYTMDWDLWVRLWRGGAKFGFLEETLSRVLWSAEAKTGGFGAARRAELERIIGAHSDIVSKIKSRIGFTLHHALEYRAPGILARAVRRRKASAGRIINGVDRTGGIHGEAHLPLVYWGETPAEALEIEFSPDAKGHMIVGGRRVKFEGGRSRFNFDAPVKAGDVVELSVEPERRTEFLGARWR